MVVRLHGETLLAILRENHLQCEESARREGRTGQDEARKEQLLKCLTWKVK